MAIRAQGYDVYSMSLEQLNRGNFHGRQNIEDTKTIAMLYEQ